MTELNKIEDRISIRKDRLMQSALSLFADHGYQRIDRYLAYDETNYYFTPKK